MVIKDIKVAKNVDTADYDAKNLTLKGLQSRIDKTCKDNGWDKDRYDTKFLLFVEEVGELAKALRNHHKLYVEDARAGKNSKIELEEEFADVLSYLVDLANSHGIDLEDAVLKKEKINNKRKWK